VQPAEFEFITTLGSGVRPHLPLLLSRLGTKTPASIVRIFVCETHKSRASEGALTKDPLLAPKKKGALLPLSGEEYSSQIVQTPGTGFQRAIPGSASWKPSRGGIANASVPPPRPCIGIYCTVIEPRLVGSPVGVPPELAETVCTAWVDVPVVPVVMLPHPTSVAAMASPMASTTRWRRRSLPVMISIPNAKTVSSAAGVLDLLNGAGHMTPA